jgi:hypothetical protein
LDYDAPSSSADVSACRGPLGELVAEMSARAPTSTSQVAETLAYFRSTWAGLSATRQLARSRESVPENAGPLNSSVLVHRALSLMQDVSPEYLHRFVSYADELRWLAQLGTAGESAPKPEPAKAVRRGDAKGRAGK